MSRDDISEYVLVAVISILFMAFASMQTAIYFLLTYILLLAIQINNKLCKIAKNNSRGDHYDA